MYWQLWSKMIYVFKTNVKTKAQINRLRPHLDHILSSGEWNFDLEDCDKILRVDSPQNIAMPLIQLLETNDFLCEEIL